MGNVADGQLLSNAMAGQNQAIDWHSGTVVVHLLLFDIYLQLLV